MNKTGISLLTFIAFLPYYFIITGVLPLFNLTFANLSYPFFYALYSLILIAILYIIHRKKNPLPYLGLDKNVMKAIIYGTISILPMLIYSIICGSWDGSLPVIKFFDIIIIAGFFEELFFRGFLFGQLFRYAGWGFIPASMIVAVIFGCGHLYQGSSLMASLTAGLITGLGSIFFSWIYVECEYNLLCPIVLHIFMNFSWSAFTISSNGAVGSTVTNIFRILTVIIAIALVIFHKRKNGISYQVTAKSLWINAKPCSTKNLRAE